MPTNYTTNYQLNQWEPSDQVLRTDFNADNLKIETVLTQISGSVAGKLGRAEHILTVSQTESVKQFSVDLSSINWNEWEYVALTFDQGSASDSTTGSDGILYFTLPNVSAYSSNGNLFASSRPNPVLLLFFPLHDATRRVESICIGSACSFAVGKNPFSNLKSVQISLSSTNSYLSPNTKVEVFGAK